jgi:hypothetical protein
VDDSNVHVYALVTSIKEINEKDMKDQGLTNVEDISIDVVLWHLSRFMKKHSTFEDRNLIRSLLSPEKT